MSILAQIKYLNTTTLPGADPIHPATLGSVVIEITDPATGNFANGNNVVVSYTQSVNGVVTAKTATVAGQMQLIYVGVIKDIANGIFNTWTITGQSETADPAPPVNQCDLSINYITVNNPESSPGANDGQITVNATSSYLPVQYSIDNVHFQTSPVFSGLHGGAYTIYCTDANPLGCSKTAAVTIPLTKNLLISDPSVNLTGSNISRWSAAFNPVVFTYQRKDFEVTNILIDTATNCPRIMINTALNPFVSTALPSTSASAGAITQTPQLNYEGIYVYLNAGPYNGTYKVKSYSPSDNSLVIDADFNGAASGYININLLRPYYKILTKITYLDPLSGRFKTMTSVNRPDSPGIVRADISNFLQSLLRTQDSSDYTETNFRDTNLSASYTISYSEQYEDVTNPGTLKISPDIIIDTPYYVTYTARQLQSRYGGSMAEYVTFPANQQAKWVTDFAEPAFTNGYPFDLSFIYSEAMAGRQLYYKLTMLDINRNPINVNSLTTYLLNEDSSWLLNQDASKFIIARQDLFNTPIVEHVGLNRLLINNTFQDDAYYFTIALYYDDTDGSPIQVTKLQTVRIDHAPVINSVYMRWLGLTGSETTDRVNEIRLKLLESQVNVLQEEVQEIKNK